MMVSPAKFSMEKELETIGRALACHHGRLQSPNMYRRILGERWLVPLICPQEYSN